MALFRSADSVSLAYSNLAMAKEWWVQAFDCQQVKVPDYWDDPLPSDVALKFRGEDEPTISLSDKSEARAKHMQPMSTVPIIYSDKIKKAHEYISTRGVLPGPLQDGGNSEFFEVRDLEGNTIEICEEP
jgi:hypothetical protein